jgi:hypothetical protein
MGHADAAAGRNDPRSDAGFKSNRLLSGDNGQDIWRWT